MSKVRSMDMVNGPLLGKILRFSVPLMLSGMLQFLYNAADVIVVGKFAGAASLAAVGSTGALVNLLVNLFMGVSVGCNVLVARYYGARNEKAVSETVHCAVAASAVIGLLAGAVGLILSTPLLRLMGSPEDVLPLASLYLKIYFCGMPFNIAYNFGAAVLRAVGDTRRPLYILSATGAVNVALNLLTVIVFFMGVAGVALATAASQLISCLLVLRCLTLRDDCCRLVRKEIRIYGDKLKEMIRIGLPAGIQSSLFSLSNVVIQSSINSFGSTVVAGNAAAANIEGFVYISMNAIYQACITFVSQNLGAGKPDRIRRVMRICLCAVTVIGGVLGMTVFLLHHPLLGIYASDAEGLREQIIAVGHTRLLYIGVVYFLCGWMEVAAGGLRGLGRSWLPTSIALLGSCLFRIVWINTVFRSVRTLDMIYISYPISWTVTFAAHLIFFLIALHGLQRRLPKQAA
ncbi:MAG: MATE family efflux transporter [Clostridia bacterium]|nr:MATE family efflux transporter [Clostridia bacterium]